MKKKILLFIIFTAIYIIYILFNNQKINYVSIGDSIMKGVNPHNIVNYSYNDYAKEYLIKQNSLKSFNNNYYSSTIKELTLNIKNNQTIFINKEEFYLKRVLRESNVLVISCGMDELAINYSNDMSNNYKYFDNLYFDIEELVKEIRKYTVNKVIYIGYYNPTKFYNRETDSFFYYMNEKLEYLMKKNNIIYLDIYELIKKNNYQNNPNNYHLNTLGYTKIGKEIIKRIENT